MESTEVIGATPFWLASQTAHISMMRVLSAHGADPFLPRKNGTTPLMVAAGLGQKDVSDTGGVVESNALEAVQVNVQLGADVNATNELGQTALHGAAALGMNRIIQFLAEQGAKIDVKDHNGFTPLDIAQGARLNAVLTARKSTADLLRKLSESSSRNR